MIQTFLVNPSDPTIQQEVWKLLQAIDPEFVPPLSARSGTADMALARQSIPGSLETYFQGILTQQIIMARVADAWAGVMTFKLNYQHDLLGDLSPCTYITTLGVFPEFRGQGVARALYHFILAELPAPLRARVTATRTWSTNIGHLHLLAELGFSCAAVLNDHRGPGIDTVYYARAVSAAGKAEA